MGSLSRSQRNVDAWVARLEKPGWRQGW